MRCKNNFFQDNPWPCGKCMACRIARTREWAIRIMHEYEYWEEAIFLTLTYNDENIPEGGTLVPDHLVRFLKNLNKKTKIRYYACGEYGEKDKTERPHYHAIVFGIGRHDEMFTVIQNKGEGYRGICKTWPYGEVFVGDLTYDSARYTASYVQKKLYGSEGILKYGERYPPFPRQSKSIGLQWAEDHKEQLAEGRLTLRGVPVSIPRYYVKKLDLDLSPFQQEAIDRYEDYCAARGIKNRTNDSSELAEVIHREAIQSEKNKEALARMKNKESQL